MDVMDADKKTLKKWLTAKRNKRDWGLVTHVQAVQDEQQRLRDLEQEQTERLSRSRAAVGGDDEPPAWMARAHEARNRLNDKKRGSAERWNRFAGTSESGGRGL